MTDANKTPKTKASEEDQELSDLLDSALADFSKNPEKLNKESSKEKQANDAETTAVAKSEDTEETIPESLWTEEFIKQATEQFESNFASLLRESGASDLGSAEQNLQKLAEAAAQAAANPGEVGDADFTRSITQALQGLSEGAEGLQAPFKDMFMNTFGQGDGSGEDLDFTPFMQGMMQSLLSKEILYPSLKDIIAKYPAWLEANGGSLPTEERRKYEQQYELMNQVCAQLDKENENDTPEQKKIQFETVLSLMQKLQDCGQPPTELVGDLGPGLPFDSQGNPEQCTLM